MDHERTCSCGSGLTPWPLHDARGIFCTYVCERCVDRKMEQFRPDIFTDADYWHDEPTDDE